MVSPSAFAGNELLIDLERLSDYGWLTDADLAPDPLFRNDRINYPAVRPFRMSPACGASRAMTHATPFSRFVSRNATGSKTMRCSWRSTAG